MPDIRAGQPAQPIGQYKPLHVTGSGTLVPVGNCVSTTSTTVIAPGSVIVTPVAMTNIVRGKRLNIVNGSTTENVTVTAVTASTFTATFVNSYSGTTNIYSTDGSWLGPVIIGNTGTSSSVLTLYNGHTGMLPVAGAIISVVTTLPAAGGEPFTLGFQAICDKGLFYTFAPGTGADVTIHYLDHPPAAAV